MKKHSDHLLPSFKCKAALSLLETLNHSHIKPYTDDEKENAELKNQRIIKGKKK